MIFKPKKILLRTLINLKRNKALSHRVQKSFFEEDIIKICRNLIRSSESLLYISLDSRKKFVVYPPKQINIVLEENKLIFSNYTYYYEIFLSDSGVNNLTRIFNSHFSALTNTLEEQTNSNSKTTLNNIFLNTLNK